MSRAPNDPSNAILAARTPEHPKRVTVADYYQYVAEQDRESLGKFIDQRLRGRYLIPLNVVSCDSIPNLRRSGFAIVATSCLLMETLECFARGLADSSGVKGAELFRTFFNRDFVDGDLKILRNEPFYTHVRCGILHQGETTGGWRVQRQGEGELFSKGNGYPEIDAVLLHTAMDRTVRNYAGKIATSEWDAPILVAFRHKMNCTIGHLQP